MHRFLPLLAVVATLTLVACAASHSASGTAPFAPDSAHEINDEDVAKAFAARPQLTEGIRVAYYMFDDAKADDVGLQLAKTRNVASVYRIPAFLVTGHRRFQERNPWVPPQEVSAKKLRLLGARAHADVLVIFDHGWRGGGVNGWYALAPLVVPVFFVPFLSNETESYAQAWVIDVRNGYLYGDVTSEVKSGGSVTIYGPKADAIAQEQWPALLESLGRKLEATLAPTALALQAAPSAEP